MSSNEPKVSIVLELFKDKRITYSTIESLIKYGFDTNESLLCLEFDLDFPQMTDICLSQKCLLRNRLTDFRNKYNKSDINANNCLISIEKQDSSESYSQKITDYSIDIEIFNESEAIVRSMRDQVIRQLYQSLNLAMFKNIIPLEFSFEPIVDHLRDSLIKVEKQLRERDLIINKQKTDLEIKQIEIQRLETKCKELETQLMSEKLKVEKLDNRLKNIRTNQSNNIFDDKYLENLMNIYCNNINDNSKYDRNTFEDFITTSSKLLNFNSNLKNCLTDDENNSLISIFNTNLEQFKAKLFSDYVSKINNYCSNDLNGSVPKCSNDQLPSSSPNKDVVPHRWKTCAERKAYEFKTEELGVKESNDLSEEYVESIVCEPDFNLDQNYSTYKTKSHLKVEDNRIVVNISDGKSKPRVMSNQSNNCKEKRQKSCQSLLTNGESSSLLKSFRCYYNNCYLSFVSSEGLKRHIRSVHTKEKPFECNFIDCRKRFGRSDALKEHLKRHMGLKTFNCSYAGCNFKSVSSNSLKRHTFSIHLKDKHFKCLQENCNKTFGRKDSFKKHMEKQHLIYETNIINNGL